MPRAGRPPPCLLKTIAPAAPSGRGDGPDRRRHDRHPAAAPSCSSGVGGGALAAFATTCDRVRAEWGELLDLGALDRAAATSPRGWCCSAARPATRCCALWRRPPARGSTSSAPGSRGDEPDYPFRFLDQDVLNAVRCASRLDPARIVDVRPTARRRTRRSTACGSSTRRALRCALRRRRRAVPAPPLPPQAVARQDAQPTSYSRLLTRLLLGPDVAAAARLRPSCRCGCARRRGGGAARLGDRPAR